nr:hypothetical protein CFP56_55283 [Quercus suber]
MSLATDMLKRRYRLEMQVGDTTEHANFVVFVKKEEKLIKVLGTQLFNMEERMKMVAILFHVETTKRGTKNGNEVSKETIFAEVKKTKFLKK